MKRTILHTAVLVLTLTIFAASFSALPAFAEERNPDAPVSLAELIDNARQYDNTVIQFQGEAIGDILYRGSDAWVNISDANNSAIGVYMSAEMAGEISVLGRYGTQGDTLLITGTFHRACSDHGGDMDIHADQVKILNRGKAVAPEIPNWLPYLAGGSAVCAILLCAFAFCRIRHYNTDKTAQRSDDENGSR